MCSFAASRCSWLTLTASFRSGVLVMLGVFLLLLVILDTVLTVVILLRCGNLRKTVTVLGRVVRDLSHDAPVVTTSEFVDGLGD